MTKPADISADGFGGAETERAGLTLTERAARKAVLSRLAHFTTGELTIIEGDRTHVFGRTSPAYGVRATIRMHDPRVWRAVMTRGTIGAAEAYAEGHWSADDLAAVARLFVKNRRAMSVLEGGLAKLAVPLQKLRHVFRKNTASGSKKNIAAHYDAGNEFYGLFLDPTMSYSCAIFRSPDEDLEKASVRKLDRVCRKLELSPDDHLLEIGTGWGGLAIHAAKRFGCRVTTTTISARQYEYARERIRAEGLESRITLLDRDYRALTGEYTKAVSIEMIEAVGHDFMDVYFRRFTDLVRPDGLILIQAIVIADEFFEAAKRSVDFIQRYIFPGSALPSIASIMRSVARVTDLRLAHLEDIGEHYARTLLHWRRRFVLAADKIRRLGWSEEAIRLWEYYFAYCEGGFLERSIGDVQLLFARPDRPATPTFDWPAP